MKHPVRGILLGSRVIHFSTPPRLLAANGVLFPAPKMKRPKPGPADEFTTNPLRREPQLFERQHSRIVSLYATNHEPRHFLDAL
jgi:hypothetical protein